MKPKIEGHKQLREMIRFLERTMGTLDESENSCCGISNGQCHALVEIGRNHSLSLQELSNILGLDNSTLSRTVNILVMYNFVEREINPSDRRYVKIKLTEKGHKLFEGIETNMNLFFEKVYEEIPVEKRRQVLESLDLVIKAIHKMDCCKV